MFSPSRSALVGLVSLLPTTALAQDVAALLPSADLTPWGIVTVKTDGGVAIDNDVVAEAELA